MFIDFTDNSLIVDGCLAQCFIGILDDLLLPLDLISYILQLDVAYQGITNPAVQLVDAR